MKEIKLEKGSFSSNAVDDLEMRLDIGVVEFSFIRATDTETGSKGETRYAKGTRNLSMSFIPFGDIPFGGRIPPEHVLTYWDLDREGWRCFVRNNLVDYSEIIEVEDGEEEM